MAAPGLTADTSVIVPSLVAWHPLHGPAALALADVRRVPAHAFAEAFSVLTRLPPPWAVRPVLACQLLLHAFPDEVLPLSVASYRTVVGRLAEADMGGGRVCDAIVGAAAAEAGLQLLTADRRAVATYALVGAQFVLVE